MTDTTAGTDESGHEDALYPSLETDTNGWEYVGQFGAAVSNWVDDADDPRWGVTVLSTGTSVQPEGSDGTRTSGGRFGSYGRVARTAHGYELVVGPSKGDVTDTETVDEWFGDPDQTPREVEQELFTTVLRAAREWLQEHDPEEKRADAIEAGFVPDPLPEPQEDTADGQGTLGTYAGGVSGGGKA